MLTPLKYQVSEDYKNSLHNSLSKTVSKLSDEELRNLLSEEITPEIFEKLKEAHNTFYIKSKDTQLSTYERQMYETFYLDFDFLEGIDNYSDLQDYIRRPLFIYNLWCVLTLEKLLRFKAFIIPKDLTQIAYCGPDLTLVEDSKIQVDNYIILFWDGHSFDLVTYNGKNKFNKDNIPKLIKKEFNKCSKHPNFTKLEN